MVFSFDSMDDSSTESMTSERNESNVVPSATSDLSKEVTLIISSTGKEELLFNIKTDEPVQFSRDASTLSQKSQLLGSNEIFSMYERKEGGFSVLLKTDKQVVTTQEKDSETAVVTSVSSDSVDRRKTDGGAVPHSSELLDTRKRRRLNRARPWSIFLPSPKKFPRRPGGSAGEFTARRTDPPQSTFDV